MNTHTTYKPVTSTTTTLLSKLQLPTENVVSILKAFNALNLIARECVALTANDLLYNIISMTSRSDSLSSTDNRISFQVINEGTDIMFFGVGCPGNKLVESTDSQLYSMIDALLTIIESIYSDPVDDYRIVKRERPSGLESTTFLGYVARHLKTTIAA